MCSPDHTLTTHSMVCDYFYPQAGGVELHIQHLAQELIKLGHNVIVITHNYGQRRGVRYCTNGLKVYYVPLFVFYRQTTFPTVFAPLGILRNIYLREQIDILHGHAGLSTLANEAIFHAASLGIKTVLTDHSLYGFSETNYVWGQKVLEFNLINLDRTICVSNTCKENMCLRGSFDPYKCSVIPNAVVSKDFAPLPHKPKKDHVTIVVISRLFPNKGADLLCAMIPKICQQHPTVKFIIAGDGPKFIEIQQTVETHRLQDRITLMGAVKHQQVRDVMVQGEIYLHPSLTEAFGTVLVEAASCGLLVVTTRVGGIPEVLPNDMTIYANTSVDSLVKHTLHAIKIIERGELDTSKFHERVEIGRAHV